MTKLIAHRGASSYAIENSLEAFSLAFDQGANGVEGDFLLTKDRKIIAFHDLNTKRLLGISRQTKDLTLEQIRNESSYYIPELNEVLELIPKNKEIVIELKCGREVEKELMKILTASSIHLKQVTVISFRLPTLIRLRKLCSKIKILWIRNFTMSSCGLNPSPEKVREIISKENFDGLSLNAPKVDKKMIELFNGFAINTWTVDDPERFYELKKLGCTSISTNCPKKILSHKHNEKRLRN